MDRDSIVATLRGPAAVIRQPWLALLRSPTWSETPSGLLPYELYVMADDIHLPDLMN